MKEIKDLKYFKKLREETLKNYLILYAEEIFKEEINKIDTILEQELKVETYNDIYINKQNDIIEIPINCPKMDILEKKDLNPFVKEQLEILFNETTYTGYGLIKIILVNYYKIIRGIKLTCLVKRMNDMYIAVFIVLKNQFYNDNK